jgi:hypothetical protein
VKALSFQSEADEIQASKIVAGSLQMRPGLNESTGNRLKQNRMLFSGLKLMADPGHRDRSSIEIHPPDAQSTFR